MRLYVYVLEGLDGVRCHDADEGQLLLCISTLCQKIFDLQAAGRTVYLRHAEVQHDELVGRLALLEPLLHHLDGFFSVAAKVGSEVELLDQALHGDDVEGTIVADQYLAVAGILLRGLLLQLDCGKALPKNVRDFVKEFDLARLEVTLDARRDEYVLLGGLKSYLISIDASLIEAASYEVTVAIRLRHDCG